MNGSRRRPLTRWLLAAIGLVGLWGCPAEEQSVVGLRLAADGCFSEIAGGTACRAALLERVSETNATANACLVVETVGTADRIARVPLIYANGSTRLVDPADGQLTLTNDRPVDIGLFLFDAEAPCDAATDLRAQTSCEGVPNCRFRLLQRGVITETELALTFAEGGVCTVQQGLGDETPETCNGADEDCDGRIDEDDGGPLTESCESPHPQVGECVGMGVRTCVDGAFGDCEGYPEPQPEMCIEEPGDRRDFDCDGNVDEGLTNCGTCDPEACPCQPTGDEICDGLDNDCDGRGDEGFDFTSPERCGGCDNDCAADVPAGARENTAFVCMGGTCEIADCTAPYVDFNGDPSDGCECQQGEAEIPFDGIDQTCDGVDFAGDAIYVSADQGEDADDAGAADRPYRTLAAAVARAASRGTPVTIILEGGEYPLGALLDIPGGVSIAGGYTYAPGASPAWQRGAPEPAQTAIIGPARVLRYPQLDAPTALVDVEVRAEPETPTGNSIAVIADSDALEYLTLARVVLTAGVGGRGEDGVVNELLATEGNNGDAGRPAASGACQACGGNGGLTADCGDDLISASGGDGGDGGLDAMTSAEAGTNGALPEGWVGGPAAPGGAAGNPPNPPVRGGTGLAGRHGEHSRSGSPGGYVDSASDVYWTPERSPEGARGVPGAGGGGGGGAAASPSMDGGGGGGGGGSGGCPGYGGGGALGGYGSFGLVVAGRSRVRLIASTVNAGAGGVGGVGARGQRGGQGGMFGAGGDDADCPGCEPGERGGQGGRGGCGGSSGGGAGGPSFAILRIGPDPDPGFPRVDIVPAAGPGAPAVTLASAPPTAGGEAADQSNETWRNACDGVPDAAPGPAGATGDIGCCPADGPCVDDDDEPFGCEP